MEKPKIELRKVKHAKSLSEETPAYTADIWVDGKLFCHVSNHGHGGPDMHYPPKGGTMMDVNREIAELNKRIAATYPKWGSEFSEGAEYDYELELLCHEMLGDLELEKGVKRDLAKKIMFVKPADGKIYSVKIPNAAQKDQLMRIVKEKHGIAKTLNEMTLQEAVAIYKAA